MPTGAGAPRARGGGRTGIRYDNATSACAARCDSLHATSIPSRSSRADPAVARAWAPPRSSSGGSEVASPPRPVSSTRARTPERESAIPTRDTLATATAAVTIPGASTITAQDFAAQLVGGRRQRSRNISRGGRDCRWVGLWSGS